jgi:hypothetical protein
LDFFGGYFIPRENSKSTYGGKNILDAKDLLSRMVACGYPSKIIYGEKTKGSLSRRIASGLWGFTFDSPNRLN